MAPCLSANRSLEKTIYMPLKKPAAIWPWVFWLPFFFSGIGLEFNFTSIKNVGLLLGILIVSYLSKIMGGFLGGRMAGLSIKTSFTLGIGLNARGIMELVIANIAYRNNLINTEVFSILVVMGIVTTLTTPLLLKKAFGKIGEPTTT